MFNLLFKFAVQQAWFREGLVLILPVVPRTAIPIKGMVKNLPNLHTRINPHGLDYRNLQRPCPTKPNIAETCSGMDVNSQSAY